MTGAAGFIGSHLVDALLRRGDEVIAVDNLSSGRMDNLRCATQKSDFKFVRLDLKEPTGLRELLDGVSIIFHFAANPEVRVGEADPSTHFRENLLATFNLLEATRLSGDGKVLVFASTSTVFGEPTQLPTREDYGPLYPISTYGASKLGCEALISSYAFTHGIRGLIFRMGNCVGARTGHGVIADFLRKLKSNPGELEILGDGTQTKSYIHVSDAVNGIFIALEDFLRSNLRIDTYNISSSDQVSVKRIAQIVIDEFGLKDVDVRLTGGVDGGRGWLGDVKVMHLSVDKLRKLGWHPRLNSEEAVHVTAKELLAVAP